MTVKSRDYVKSIQRHLLKTVRTGHFGGLGKGPPRQSCAIGLIERISTGFPSRSNCTASLVVKLTIGNRRAQYDEICYLDVRRFHCSTSSEEPCPGTCVVNDLRFSAMMTASGPSATMHDGSRMTAFGPEPEGRRHHSSSRLRSGPRPFVAPLRRPQYSAGLCSERHAPPASALFLM